jgi:hypothetical protein
MTRTTKRKWRVIWNQQKIENVKKNVVLARIFLAHHSSSKSDGCIRWMEKCLDYIHATVLFISNNFESFSTDLEDILSTQCSRAHILKKFVFRQNECASRSYIQIDLTLTLKVLNDLY